MRYRSCCSRWFVAAVVAFTAACGGGSGDGGTPPTPGFSVTLSGTALSIAQGASGSVTATIARTGSFSGTVNLSAEGVPNGLTASFNPAAITSGTTATTLQVTVAESVVPGSYSFTIRGQAAEVSEQKTATVTLTVTAKPAITLTLSAAGASAAQGGSLTYTATVARTNYPGAVTVAVTGAPNGVTTSVSNAGDVYTVVVTVGGNVPAGVHTLTTTASGTGVTAASAQFTLTVTAVSPSIQLTATPAALTASAGGAVVQTTLAITRLHFTGTVVVAVQSGLPPGTTAAISPQGPTLATSVTVSFTVGAGTAPGNYTVVLQGAGFQATAGLVQVALTVTPPAPTLALSATPAALSIQQGASLNSTINIARSNFTGAVTLVASGLPGGVTAQFNTSPTTAITATLTLTVGAGVATGSYQVTITGSATGVTDATTTIALSVTSPGSGSSIVFSFCGTQSTLPIWFAAQSGTAGAWTTVAAGANNSYSFSIADVGGVAWVQQVSANQYHLNVSYGTAAELTAQGASVCLPSSFRSVTGSVNGFGTGNADLVSVSFGSGFALPAPTFALPNFTISGVAAGAHDLVGTRSTFNILDPLNPLTLNKVFIKRGLNPPNGGSVGTVDFTGSDAFDPITKQITITNTAAGELVSVSNTFMTGNGSFGSMGAVTLGAGNSVNLFVVPPANTLAGDVQALAVNAAIISGGITSQLRSMALVYKDPANQNVTLGAALNAPLISVLGTAPYARLRSQLTRQADYANYWTTNYSQLTTADQRTATISMTEGYIGNATSFDVSVPDFSTLPAWQNLWGLKAGNLTTWNVSAFGWLTGTGSFSDGTTYRIGQRQGIVTP